MQKKQYDRNLVLLYNELTKYKIYDSYRCKLCNTCLYSKEYNEETKLFDTLKKRLGTFYQCQNTKTTITTTVRNDCSYYVKE